MFDTISPPLRRRFAALGVCVCLVSCGSDRSGPRPGSLPQHDRAVEPAWFTDATASTGLDFVHFNGMTGEFYYPEVIAPGVALFDYDNDGDLDVFLGQGQKFAPGKPASPVQSSHPLSGRLFRNDLEIRADGAHVVRFTDVTEASGIKTTGYGMGVAAGDYNNDGCLDLYVTALGRNQLFRNDCQGHFTDVSKQSGLDDPG